MARSMGRMRPWAFLRQYLKAFKEGFMYVRSPVTGEMDPVCLKPYDPMSGKGFLCISWWSKNYSKWIEEFRKPESILHRYPLHMFNFTATIQKPYRGPARCKQATGRALLYYIYCWPVVYCPYTLYGRDLQVYRLFVMHICIMRLKSK